MNKYYSQQIALDLEKLGIKKGDVLLVHSSLKSLGATDCTPEDVILGLCLALGKSGTLIMPALSYLYCNPKNRHFDYYKTPSNVGAIPEYFRTSFPNVKRSLCPTHSCCAWGKLASEVTSSHHLDNTPCGKNSPFRKVFKLGGKILFLGCTSRPNTSMHAVEELVEPDYLWNGEYEYILCDSEGKEHKIFCKAHGFKNTAQRYDRAEALLVDDEIKRGKVLKADCVLMDAVSLWKKAEQKYHEDPHYFVDIKD